ncbi:MAG: SDR family oxidoreductase [Actinomycetota bacterium]
MTGAGGGLGRAFLAAAPDQHEVHGFSRQQLDVRSFDAVRDALDPLAPDVILHLAAMTSVDRCEEEPQRAGETNVLGSFNVAAAARRTGAVLLLLSTDYVFDGQKGALYDEGDRPNPLSLYGWTKLAGERAAESVGPDLVIVRTAWVFGTGDDFLTSALRGLRGGQEIRGIADQVGSPTEVGALAERLLAVAASGLRGVVHLAGPEPITWHEVLVRARQLGDLPGTVLAQKADELGRPAVRPPYSALTSVVLPGTDVPPMPSLDESIRKVLADVV